MNEFRARAEDEDAEAGQYENLSQHNRCWKKQQIPPPSRCPCRPHDDGDYSGAGRYVSDGHEDEGDPLRRTNQDAETDQGTEKRRDDGDHCR